MLNVILIKEQIKEMSNTDSNEVEQAIAVEISSQKLAQIIVDAIKSAQVVIPPSAINVVTTCSTGPGTGINPAPVFGNLE